MATLLDKNRSVIGSVQIPMRPHRMRCFRDRRAGADGRAARAANLVRPAQRDSK
jgi:hypothetical protein